MKKTLALFALLSLTSAGFGNLLFLNATEVRVLSNNQRVEALGKVKALYGNYRLKADRLVYLRNKGLLIAEGNVFLTDGKGVFLRAKKLVYHLSERVIELFDVRGEVKGSYINSSYVRIRGEIYLFKEACATKCADRSAEVCARKFVFKRQKGEGVAYSATVKVEGVPIFYTPYYAFQTKRKTGFLAPKMGVDSYGDFVYRQPFFWAISPYADLTFTGDYRAGGLYGGGLQFRKYFARDSYLDTLNQLYYDDAYPGKWWEGRDYHRRLRYLLSGKGYKGNLTFQWELPSDIDYFYDIFFFDKDQHYKSFAKSFIQYTLNGERFNLNLKGEYFYNLTTRDRSKDLATLPDIYLYLKPQPLGEGFTYDLTTELTNFYTDNKSFWRYRLVPKLGWKHTFGTTPVAFYFKPYYIYYSSTRYGNRKNVLGYSLTAKSLLYNFNLVRTENWNLFSSWEWVYKFHPFEEKNHPPFDTFDELSKQNLLTLRGVNSLNYGGKEVANFIVEQPYNFYSGYNFPTDGAYVNGKLLPLKLYYNINPPSGDISLGGQIYYDHHLSEIVYNTAWVNWTAVKTLTAKLDLDFSYTLSKDHLGEKQTDQYSYGLKLNWKNLRVEGKNYYDSLRGKNIRNSLSVDYNRNCWSVGLRYQREYNFDNNRYDWNLLLVFNLFSNPFNFLVAGGRK